MLCGDFNEVLCQEEHDGPSLRSENEMELFRSCLDDCGLTDLGFSGPTFTWSNRQSGDALVRVCLDRAVANGAFKELFDDVNVENLITTTTDHFAVLIRLQQFVHPEQRRPVQSGFRYEAAWIRAPDYQDVVVLHAWADANQGSRSLQSTWDSLQEVASKLQKWGVDSFGSVKKEIRQLERKLKALRLQSRSAANDLAASKAERRLCELFEREEIMARQRSRVEWLKGGDRNTAFFHGPASARRSTNKVRSLVREDGTRCDDLPGIKGMAEEFCGKLFTLETFDDTAVIDAIVPKVTADMNADLTKPYLDEEIKTALFQMGPTKAPGPDGFPALFYQKHWDFFKESICSAVRGFLLGDGIPKGVCDSVIVLIPKVNNPVHLKNFIPISLCNVLYKIASKVLANRL
jgi:hypothetical protein